MIRFVCDVAGCGRFVDAAEGRGASPYPVGWRCLTWEEDRSEPESDPQPVEMPAMLVGYLKTVARMMPPRSPRLPIQRRALICPAQEMPALVPLADDNCYEDGAIAEPPVVG